MPRQWKVDLSHCYSVDLRHKYQSKKISRHQGHEEERNGRIKCSYFEQLRWMFFFFQILERCESCVVVKTGCFEGKLNFFLIPGFRRDVDEICALLGYYAASCGNPLPTFRDNVSVPSSRVIPEQRRSQNFSCF